MIQSPAGVTFAPSWFATIAVASTLVAQPKFDVVSIRPVSSNVQVNLPQDYTPYQPEGHFNDPRTNLLFLITMAYDISHGDRHLLGLPKWAQDWTQSSYAVEAKAADFPVLSPTENTAQIRLMMREMLADRFKLRLHTDTLEESVLMMTVDKGGLRIKEVAAPVPPETAGRVNAAMGDTGGRMIAKKGTMSRLASIVSLFLEQDVIDQTGLTGYYDFDIRWEALRVAGAPPPAQTLGEDGIALFLSTLHDEFGLRFSKGKGPYSIGYWIRSSRPRRIDDIQAEIGFLTRLRRLI